MPLLLKAVKNLRSSVCKVRSVQITSYDATCGGCLPLLLHVYLMANHCKFQKCMPIHAMVAMPADRTHVYH